MSRVPGPAALSVDSFAIDGRLFEVVTALLLVVWLVVLLRRR